MTIENEIPRAGQGPVDVEMPAVSAELQEPSLLERYLTASQHLVFSTVKLVASGHAREAVHELTGRLQLN